MTNQSERLAIVETEVKLIKDELHEHKLDTKHQFEIVNGKLDDLIQLKYKGMGAFWLAASIIGSGIGGLLLSVLNYFKGA